MPISMTGIGGSPGVRSLGGYALAVRLRRRLPWHGVGAPQVSGWSTVCQGRILPLSALSRRALLMLLLFTRLQAPTWTVHLRRVAGCMPTGRRCAGALDLIYLASTMADGVCEGQCLMSCFIVGPPLSLGWGCSVSLGRTCGTVGADIGVTAFVAHAARTTRAPHASGHLPRHSSTN